MSSSLAVSERSELDRLESTIRSGIGSFVEVGRALQRIRDGRLYREDFDTFKSYCITRWLMKRAHAYRLIEGATIAESLSPIGDKPRSESQARPLSALPRNKQSEAWAEAVRTAPGGKVTAKHVEATVVKISAESGLGNRTPRSPRLRVGDVLLRSIETIEVTIYALERVSSQFSEATPEIQKRYRDARARFIRLVRAMGGQHGKDQG